MAKFLNNPAGLPDNLDPTRNQIINGKLYTQQEDRSEDAEAQYLGLPDAQAMHASRGENDWQYPTQWVPGDNSPGMSGWDIAKVIGLMAAAGAGGSALAGAFGAGGAGAATGAAGIAGGVPATLAETAATAGTLGTGMTPALAAALGPTAGLSAVPAATVAAGMTPGLAAALGPTTGLSAPPSAAATGAAGIGGGVGPTAAQLEMTEPELAAAAETGGSGAASTGGLMSKISPLATAAGKGLSAMAAARAQGRLQQQGANLSQDQEQTQRDIANARQGNEAASIDLNQREFKAGQAKQALANAFRGGLLQGVQDVNFNLPDRISSHMGTMTGGLRPSALIGKDQIGSDLQRQALLQLMRPDQASTGPMAALDTTSGLKAPAGTIPFQPLTQMPKPNALDTFLQYAGPIAGLAGSYFGG